MSMITVTFKLPSEILKKLKSEPSKNRRFNSQSEILRVITTLYLEDPGVRQSVHYAMNQRYTDIMNEEL